MRIVHTSCGGNAPVLFESIGHDTPLPFALPRHGDALRRLLVGQRLSVAFQPIWNLHSGGILAFEALTRPAADYGLTGPLEAFDIAEQLGCAHDLDAVCQQAVLSRASDLPANVLLFLNISPHTLGHDDFRATALLDAVRAAGLTPERVALEITEQCPARPEAVIRVAGERRRMGFLLALDDVGAGNAGLEMLRRLPVDFVKIDRAVIAHAQRDDAARMVFMAIIAVAEKAQCHIIVEGIETMALFDLAQQAGVRGVQGYLLGRPDELGAAVPAVPQALTA